MRVLVTGGAGFIGSHIVELLVNNSCQVIIIDNLSTGLRKNIHPAAKFIETDIREASLADIMLAERIDYVIHLAAQTSVAASLNRPRYDCAVNVQGTVNVLEGCRKSGVKRVVFSSSAAVYGNTDQLPIAEDAGKEPTSFYGLSKLTAENYITLFNQIYGLNYVILRYANVYGERQGDAGEGGVISIFCRLIKEGKPLQIFGDGGQTRDFIYAGDIAQANYLALTAAAGNMVFNISTQTETSLNSLGQIFPQVVGRPLPIKYCPPREGDIYRSCLANRKAQEILKWQPKIELSAGLTRTYNFLTGSDN